MVTDSSYCKVVVSTLILLSAFSTVWFGLCGRGFGYSTLFRSFEITLPTSRVLTPKNRIDVKLLAPEFDI
jgi:hypothetical protein